MLEVIYNNLQECYKYRNLKVADTKLYNLENCIKSFNMNRYYAEATVVDDVNKINRPCLFIICNDEIVSKMADFKKLLATISNKFDFNKFVKLSFISEHGFSTTIERNHHNVFEEMKLSDKPIFIENLLYRHFTTIIPQGLYCSPHSILSKEEADKLIEQLFSKKINMARILHSDPQAIWINASKGDIIKIERVSENCGETDYFRLTI